MSLKLNRNFKDPFTLAICRSNMSKTTVLLVAFDVLLVLTGLNSPHSGRRYSNTTVYYGIHERSECIPVDCGVTNLIHDRRSCVDFTLEGRQMWLDVSTQA